MPTRMIFVNLPVTDLKRSKTFYRALGWSVNEQFTDDNAACVVIDDNICLMLLVPKFFRGFTGRPMPDNRATTGSLYALLLGSAGEVDRLVAAALAAGGTEHIDEGKRRQERAVGMHGRTFIDPDGYRWEPFYMPSVAA